MNHTKIIIWIFLGLSVIILCSWHIFRNGVSEMEVLVGKSTPSAKILVGSKLESFLRVKTQTGNYELQEVKPPLPKTFSASYIPYVPQPVSSSTNKQPIRSTEQLLNTPRYDKDPWDPSGSTKDPWDPPRSTKKPWDPSGSTTEPRSLDQPLDHPPIHQNQFQNALNRSYGQLPVINSSIKGDESKESSPPETHDTFLHMDKSTLSQPSISPSILNETILHVIAVPHHIGQIPASQEIKFNDTEISASNPISEKHIIYDNNGRPVGKEKPEHKLESFRSDYTGEISEKDQHQEGTFNTTVRSPSIPVVSSRRTVSPLLHIDSTNQDLKAAQHNETNLKVEPESSIELLSNSSNKVSIGPPRIAPNSLKKVSVGTPNSPLVFPVTSTPISPSSSIGHTTQAPQNLYAKPYGRLGNQLFIFASMFGIAQTMGYIPKVYLGFMLPKIFSNITVAEEDMVEDGNFIHIQERDYAHFDKPLLTHYKTKNIRVCCYLQSWKYFYKSQEALRKQFTIREEYKRKAGRFLLHEADKWLAVKLVLETGTVDRNDITYVGVHIRRGDIMNMDKFGYRLAPDEYLVRAMQYFKDKYRSVLFVVAGDTKWYNTRFAMSQNDNNIVVSTDHTQYEDLAILTSCNHTIMTVGTFGWWVSWLTNGEVIYYDKALWPGTEPYRGMNHEDFFFPEWIPMH